MDRIRNIIIHLADSVARSRERHLVCRGSVPPPNSRDGDAHPTVVIDLREPGRRPAWLATAACDPYCTGCRRTGIDLHPSAG